LETPAEYWQRMGGARESVARTPDTEHIDASVDKMRDLLGPVSEPSASEAEPAAGEEPPASDTEGANRGLQRTQLPSGLQPLYAGIPGAETADGALDTSDATPETAAPLQAYDTNVRAWQLTFWWLGLAVLIGLGAWQVRTYYLFDLAQVPALRPYLAGFCRLAACEVPARRNSQLIDLVGTSVETHPEVPGALRVTASLINRASFEQRFPLLEVTLSDKLGRVVGRRTYSDYRSPQNQNALLAPDVVTHVTLDLATPSEQAIGYEIQLISD
jgi:hypothetical protein